MAPKDRREREKAELRRKIFDASLEMLCTDGFASLSMRKLAERVEYSPAALYLHFESKEHLARALRHHGWQLLLNELRTGVAGLEGRAGVFAAGNAYVDFALDNPALYRLMFMGQPSLMRAAYADADEDAGSDAAFDLLLQVLRGLKGVDKQVDEPREIADVVWSSLHGFVSLYLSLPGLQESLPKRQCALVLTLLMDGLEAGTPILLPPTTSAPKTLRDGKEPKKRRRPSSR